MNGPYREQAALPGRAKRRSVGLIVARTWLGALVAGAAAASVYGAVVSAQFRGAVLILLGIAAGFGAFLLTMWSFIRIVDPGAVGARDEDSE